MASSRVVSLGVVEAYHGRIRTDGFRRGGTKAKMRFRTGELIGGVRIPQKLPKPEMSIRTRSVACVCLLLQDLLQSCARGGGGEWRTCAMRYDVTKLKRGRRGLNAKDNKT